MKVRNRRNFINLVENPSGMVEKVEDVKGAVKDHFEYFFKKSNVFRLVPEYLVFNSITEQDRIMLEDSFSEEAVWSFDGGKSVGPNGFSFEFLHNCWDFVKGGVVQFVNDSTPGTS